MCLPSALPALLQETRPQLVRYLERLVGPADAEDVAQVALAKALSSTDGFRGDASPKTWLFRIATHAAYDFLRRARPTVAAPPEESDEAETETAVDAEQERRLVRQQMSVCVAGYVDRLPESYRTVLALCDCNELPDREAAEVLGLTVGAMKIRLHRARRRLKEELERGCSFYRDDENVLCCDPKDSSDAAYPSSRSTRQRDESREEAAPTNPQESSMSNETLSTKEKHLIGIGASMASGCQPCTLAYAKAAHEAGACERGVRLALESGLGFRDDATKKMASFADEALAHPELDGAFRAKRETLVALMGVAAAMAGNTVALVDDTVAQARARGATDEQIRLAAEIGRSVRRGTEQKAETAFAAALGDPASAAPCCSDAPCCPPPAAEPGKPAAACGCGSKASG